MQAFIQTAVSQPFQAAFGGRHAAAYPFQNATGDHTRPSSSFPLYS
ncbi:hypothetical protein [Ralstonia pickettii]|nr:hypothetical protein [Ralstonia pickettii]